mgnify:CR=1 FL=1
MAAQNWSCPTSSQLTYLTWKGSVKKRDALSVASRFLGNDPVGKKGCFLPTDAHAVFKTLKNCHCLHEVKFLSFHENLFSHCYRPSSFYMVTVLSDTFKLPESLWNRFRSILLDTEIHFKKKNIKYWKFLLFAIFFWKAWVLFRNNSVKGPDTLDSPSCQLSNFELFILFYYCATASTGYRKLQ